MLDKRISESFDRKLREINCKSADSILESVHSLNEEDLDEMALYGLQPEYDNRSSFYNKAIVDIDNNTGDKTLYSYHTPVAKISKSGELELLPKWNSSNTTLRHVKEFLRQNGFKADSLKQITKDYLSESAGEPDVASFVEEIKLVVDPEDIDTHESDIYVKVSPKVTEILKKYNMLDNPLLSKFIDEIDHEEWYEIPFGNLGKRIKKKELEEATNSDKVRKALSKHGIDLDTNAQQKPASNSNKNHNNSKKVKKVLDKVGLKEDGRQSAEAKFKRADTIRRKYRDSLSTDELEKQSKDANSKLGKLTTNVDRTIPDLRRERETKLANSQYESLKESDDKDYQVVVYYKDSEFPDVYDELTYEESCEKYDSIELTPEIDLVLRVWDYTETEEQKPEDIDESLKESLDDKTMKEVDAELADILERNPEEHGFNVDTEEIKEYVKAALKRKGYKISVSGNDLYTPMKYHIEYWKENTNESLKEDLNNFFSREESEDYECDSEEELEDYVASWDSWNPTVKYWYDEDKGVGHITWEASSYTEVTPEKEESLDKDITVKELLDMWWNSVRVSGDDIEDEILLYKDSKDGSYELDEEHNPYGEKILDMVVHTNDEWSEDADGYPIIYAELVDGKTGE